jgi:glycosyltransferase involved in cell wall biosynthesis
MRRPIRKRRRRSADRLQALELHVQLLTEGLAAQQRALEGIEARTTAAERSQRIASVMAYVRATKVDEDAVVSVVMATRNRARELHEAIASVMSQTYTRWELIAVDDGSSDDTFDVLGSFADPRIRRFRIPHGGVAAARNRGLREVTGAYVAYLDDDNVMDPNWLRSVVWAFENWRDVDVLYGATLIDRDPGAHPPRHSGIPWLWFVPFDPQQLRQFNLTDIGSLAHRAALAGAEFDEELPALEDWDLLLRLSRDGEPLVLPVIAGVYRTGKTDRPKGSRALDDAMTMLRRKHALDE